MPSQELENALLNMRVMVHYKLMNKVGSNVTLREVKKVVLACEDDKKAQNIILATASQPKLLRFIKAFWPCKRLRKRGNIV